MEWLSNMIFGPRRKQSLPDPLSTKDIKFLQNEIVEMQENLTTYCKSGPFRIVLCGDVRSGKSSVINNIMSACRGNIVQTANVGNEDQHVTSKYIEYTVKVKGRAENSTFEVCDTRGIEASTPDEQLEALRDAIEGRYSTNEEMGNTRTAKQSDRNNRRERAAYIIFVVDATKVMHGAEPGNNNWPDRIKSLRKLAHSESIAMAVFLTKCDKIDGNVERDITNLYKSEKVQTARNNVHDHTGLSKNRIYPIVNYTEQMDAEPHMIKQTLLPLMHIVGDIQSRVCDVKHDA